MNSSEQHAQRALAMFPGGVNFQVCSFRSVGGATFFTKTANGARLTTADGQEFIDFVLTLGTAIHGHNAPKILNAIREALDRGASFGTPNPLEVEMADHGLEEDAGDVPLLDEGSHVGSHDALGVLVDDEEDSQGTSFHFKVPGMIGFWCYCKHPTKIRLYWINKS